MVNTLVASPAMIVRQLLIDLGFGVSADAHNIDAWPVGVWAVSDSVENDAPDQYVTVYDSPGIDDGRFAFSGELQGVDGVMVRVRSNDYALGWKQADAIRKAFAESVYDRTVTVDGASYLVRCFSNIKRVLAMPRGDPGSQRDVFTVNATLSVGSLPVPR